MIITTTLRKAEIAFFPLKMVPLSLRLAVRFGNMVELVGYNFLPSCLPKKLHTLSTEGSVKFGSRWLEIVCFENKYPDYENLNISDEYFSHCWDTIMDTALKPQKPITWVFGPETLLFNLCYSLAKEGGVAVHRNVQEEISEECFIVRKKTEEYYALPFSEFPPISLFRTNAS